MSEFALSRLDSIAQEINVKINRLALDMIDIGKSLNEAKELVPHGQWGSWLKQNTPFSERYAQQMMLAHTRFGNKDGMKELSWSKMVPMLSLPAGREDDFVAEHNLEEMSVRDVKAAVKEENDRSALQREIDVLNGRIAEAEKARDDARREADNERTKAEQASGQSQDYFDRIHELEEENRSLESSLNEKDGMIRILNDQASMNHPVPVLLEETKETSFSVSEWASSVSSFIAQNAALPYSGDMLKALSKDDKYAFFREAQKLQAWLDSVMGAARGQSIAG